MARMKRKTPAARSTRREARAANPKALRPMIGGELASTQELEQMMAFEIKMGELWERVALAETPSTGVSVSALKALIEQNGGQWVVKGEFSRTLKSWSGDHRCRVFSVTELQPSDTPKQEN